MGLVGMINFVITGDFGKFSLTDEPSRRFRLDQQDKPRTAVIAVDPTRRKGA